MTSNGQNDQFKFTYGVEWGSTVNLYENSYSLYVTDDKTLTEEKYSGYKSNFGGLLEAHFGLNYKRIALTAYSGVKSYDKKVNQIPLGLQILSFVGRQYDNGAFFLVDGSIGMPFKSKYKSSYSGTLGAGYRIKLTEHCSLDYSIAFSYSNVHPTTLYDSIYNVAVDADNIRKAVINKYGVTISTAIHF